MEYLKKFENTNNLLTKLEGLTHLLCIDNHVGENEEKYAFKIGRLYRIKNIDFFYVSILDEYSQEQFFGEYDIFKNFSTEQSWSDYMSKKSAEKFGL